MVLRTIAANSVTRYTDFQVNEIDMAGNVLHLRSMNMAGSEVSILPVHALESTGHTDHVELEY